MQHLRILNLEPQNYPPEARAILEGLGLVTDGPLHRQALMECLADYDVLIIRQAHQIDREVLAFGSRLKAIVTAAGELDHIDQEYAAQRGIVVISLVGEDDFLRSVPATAELTWALLLSLMRQLGPACQSVLAGEWDGDRFCGNDLAGKTLGILGLGRIGGQVARIGLAFGMRVVAYDPYRAEWMDGVEKTASMEDLLAQSNVLSVHVPLGPSTVWLVGKPQFDLLPPGAVLVNTSRGEVVDEDALIEALQEGRLAGAALDVIWGELRTDWRESPLLDYARTHPTLIITPHIGGTTLELLASTEVFAAKRLAEFLIDQGFAKEQE